MPEQDLGVGGNGGLGELAASGDAADYCKACEDPAIIPIMPVRIAWSDLLGEVNDSFTYPTSLSTLKTPGSAAGGAGFCLRTLRRGDVFIFDETNQQWSFFEHTPDDSQSGGSYTRYDLTPEDADRDYWGPPTDEGLRLPYVPDNCESILIGFFAHRLTTFWRLNGNHESCRDALMHRVQLAAPSAATFSAPIDEIADYVVEYSGDRFIHPRETWNALSDVEVLGLSGPALLRSSSVTRANKPAVMIALHDPVGVAREIAACHVNRVSLRSQFLEVNAYPLASARAVQTLQDTATAQLAAGGLEWRTRRMFQEWGTSARPEHATYLQMVETQLENFDTVLEGILAAWEKYFLLGESDPAGTKGSLQNAVLAFPENIETNDELRGLIDLAQASVASLAASQAGQEQVRGVALVQDKWESSKNPVAAAIKIIGAALGGSGTASQQALSVRNAASTLLSDLAMPVAFEVERLGREELLTEVNKFTNGIYQRTVRKVVEPVGNATREILGSRARQRQSSQLVARGHMLHQTSVPIGIYKFEGRLHVSGVEARSGLAAGANGFGIFANALNIAALTQAPERDMAQGLFGMIGTDPRLALVLTAIDTATQLMDAGNDLATGRQAVRSYFVRGRLSRSVMQQLMQGKALGDDMARSVIEAGQIRQVGASTTGSSRVMSWVGRAAAFAGFALAALDMMNAVQAWRRGDRIGILSNVALGLGAVLLTMGATSLLGSFTGVGAVVGIVLIVIGIIASFFTDDPVTQWIKGSFWGTARNYTFWDDRRRYAINEDADEGDHTRALIKMAMQPRQDYDIQRYFQREMQEFHEIVYWPQDARDPAAIYATERRGIWPFRYDSTMIVTPERSQQFSFRLPNYIDGLSELDGRVFVLINARGEYRRAAGLSEIDVTNQVRANMQVENAAQGILTSSFRIRVPENRNSNVLDDIRWDILGVYLVRGWRYGPKPDIQLPMEYHEHWFSGAWDDDARVGGQRAIRIG